MMVLAHHRISEEALFSRSLASVIPETHRAQQIRYLCIYHNNMILKNNKFKV